MSELSHNLQRLGSMGPRELAHRVREKLCAELERVGSQAGVSVCQPDFKSYLAGEPASRFYCSHREDLRPFVREHFPQWIDRAIDEADSLSPNEVTLLRHAPVPLGAPIHFHPAPAPPPSSPPPPSPR